MKKFKSYPFLFIAIFTLISTIQAFSIKQSTIKSLLISQLENGELVGIAAQMNATVIQAQQKTPFSIRFNQQVGEQMNSATQEVQKYINVNYDTKKYKGQIIELAFSNKYSPKDGPSAAVVCTLMVESILSGKKIDPNFAATGDMTALGDVRPVGGVNDKIRGAIKKGCSIIGIPSTNENYVADLYIQDGIEPLFNAQIFSLSTIDDAKKIAFSDRSVEVQKALDEFEMVKGALKRNPAYIKNTQVQAKLRFVGQTLPNHLSAKYLLLHALNKAPKKLSLVTSMNEIDKIDRNLGIIIKNNSFLEGSFKDDELYDLSHKTNHLLGILDERTKPYANVLYDITTFIKATRKKSTWSSSLDHQWNQLTTQLHSAQSKLRNDASVREDLSYE